MQMPNSREQVAARSRVKRPSQDAMNLTVSILVEALSHRHLPVPFGRFVMTDYLELNVETIGATFRNQASGLRHLAGQVLDDDFRGRLLDVALDYDHQAEKLENEFASQH